jgi:hypothetical protein
VERLRRSQHAAAAPAKPEVASGVNGGALGVSRSSAGNPRAQPMRPEAPRPSANELDSVKSALAARCTEVSTPVRATSVVKDETGRAAATTPSTAPDSLRYEEALHSTLVR